MDAVPLCVRGQHLEETSARERRTVASDARAVARAPSRSSQPSAAGARAMVWSHGETRVRMAHFFCCQQHIFCKLFSRLRHQDRFVKRFERCVAVVGG